MKNDAKRTLRSFVICLLCFLTHKAFASEQPEKNEDEKISIFSSWITTHKNFNSYKLRLKDLRNLKEKNIVEIEWEHLTKIKGQGRPGISFYITFGSEIFRDKFLDSLDQNDFLKIKTSINIDTRIMSPNVQLIPQDTTGMECLKVICEADSTLKYCSDLPYLLLKSWESFCKSWTLRLKANGSITRKRTTSTCWEECEPISRL